MVVAVVVSIVSMGSAEAFSRVEPLVVVALSALPAEARATNLSIRNGGPLPCEKDGSVFANRERRLPIESRRFYREYTVDTAGANDRGARQIVCGGRQATRPGACFYTDDHCTSFRRIAQ